MLEETTNETAPVLEHEGQSFFPLFFADDGELLARPGEKLTRLRCTSLPDPGSLITIEQPDKKQIIYEVCPREEKNPHHQREGIYVRRIPDEEWEKIRKQAEGESLDLIPYFIPYPKKIEQSA